MGKRIDKVKKFVYENAEVIGYAIGFAATVGLGVAVYGVTREKVKTMAALPVAEWKLIPIPDSLAAFGVDTFDDYTSAVEVMASEYTVSVSDLGRFGEALCSIKDISPESKAFVLVNAMKELKTD